MTYDVLQRLAGVSPAEINTDVAKDIYSQSFINKSEEFLSSSAQLDPDEKFRSWQRDVGNSWEFLPSNRDYYYDTLEKIHPGGKSGARNMILDTLTESLKMKTTFQEREWELKKQARNLPSSGTEFGNQVWSLVNRELTSTKTLLDLQAMERARASQAINLTHGLVGQSFTDLDPDVSIEAHVDDYLKGHRNNYGKEISVDKGRFIVPKDGEALPLFTIPEGTDEDVEQVLIDNIDLRPIIKNKISTDYAISQSKRLVEDGDTLSALFAKIHTGEVPNQFKNNIIIDYAYDKKDGAKITLDAINEGISKKNYHSTDDLLDDYKMQVVDIKSKIKRRIAYDT